MQKMPEEKAFHSLPNHCNVILNHTYVVEPEGAGIGHLLRETFVDCSRREGQPTNVSLQNGLQKYQTSNRQTAIVWLYVDEPCISATPELVREKIGKRRMEEAKIWLLTNDAAQ